jgi:peptidoglycan/LPS O-acetylase OafA/YrhL
MSPRPTAGPARTTFAIPSLDGIRACSFMLVFLGHAGAPMIPAGFGVTVFFFLSGYLITTLLRREAEANGKVSLKLFYLRRVFRILPPFYIVLTFALVLTLLGVLDPRFSMAALAAQALHYSNFFVIEHGWGGLLGGTGVYWSLAVEEHFYLIFPAIYAMMIRGELRGRTQHAVLLGLCALVLAWRSWLAFGEGVTWDRTYIGSDTRFDAMLFGCALAVWGNPILDFEKAERPNVYELLAAAAGVGLLLATFLIRDLAFRVSIRYSLQGIALYPLFFITIRHPRWTVARFLNLRPVRFVGTLSYSLYLLHQVMLYVAERHLPLPLAARASLALAVSFVLAVGMWRFVEKPSAKLRARFSAGVA